MIAYRYLPRMSGVNEAFLDKADDVFQFGESACSHSNPSYYCSHLAQLLSHDVRDSCTCIWDVPDLRTTIMSHLPPEGHLSLITTSRRLFEEVARMLWKRAKSCDWKITRNCDLQEVHMVLATARDLLIIPYGPESTRTLALLSMSILKHTCIFTL
jgi:hypothetical protein